MAQVEAGSWFYSGDPLRSDRDEIRFLIGDTLTDDQLLSDQEIDAAIRLAYATGSPTAGTVNVSTLAVVGTTAAGSDEITLDATTVEGTLEEGDQFRIAGHACWYFVTASNTASGNTFSNVEIRPALIAAAADNAVVTVRLFDVREAAAICCEHVSRRFARQADVSIDGRSESFSQKARAYLNIAAELRRQGRQSVPLARV